MRAAAAPGEGVFEPVRMTTAHGGEDPRLGSVDVQGRPAEDLDTALALAVTGDSEGFATLWRYLHPALVRYLRVIDHRHAEDVASETWVRVLRGLGAFRGDSSQFRAWLFTIARRLSVDAARARHRQSTALLDRLSSFERLVPVPAADTEAYGAMLLDRALLLIRQLPQDQAEVVTLRIVAGLDVAAVAELLHKKPGHVRVLCHRGLRQLAQTLTPERLLV